MVLLKREGIKAELSNMFVGTLSEGFKVVLRLTIVVELMMSWVVISGSGVFLPPIGIVLEDEGNLKSFSVEA